MSEQRHTPEPWVMDKSKWGSCRWGAMENADRGEPNMVGDVLPCIVRVADPKNDDHDWTLRPRREDQQGRKIGHAEMLANMSRIAVCVNACAGMDDPAAEIAALRAEVERLRAYVCESVRSDFKNPAAMRAELERVRAELAALRRNESEAIAAIKAAGFVTEEGEVRKVDTRGWDPGNPDHPVPLPTYADGELWMMGEDFYTLVDGEVVEFFSCEHAPAWTSSGWVVRWGGGEIELSRCYSTREAARKAGEAAQ